MRLNCCCQSAESGAPSSQTMAHPGSRVCPLARQHAVCSAAACSTRAHACRRCSTSWWIKSIHSHAMETRLHCDVYGQSAAARVGSRFPRVPKDAEAEFHWQPLTVVAYIVTTACAWVMSNAAECRARAATAGGGGYTRQNVMPTHVHAHEHAPITCQTRDSMFETATQGHDKHAIPPQHAALECQRGDRLLLSDAVNIAAAKDDLT